MSLIKLLTSLSLFIALAGCAANQVGKTLNPEDSLKVGESRIEDVVEVTGTPFSAERTKTDISLIYYIGEYKHSPVSYVPIANMIAAHTNYKIKRIVATFDYSGNLTDLQTQEGEKNIPQITAIFIKYMEVEGHKLAAFSILQKFNLEFHFDQWEQQIEFHRYWQRMYSTP